ncbi:MAG: hypothetical protein OEV61_03745 [Chloroflexota bacterium]|nr:hypothetical protein [Chloroflexota bacterium]MDH5242660.1 hypothetical protein [Chloroflexota bacterium]
MARAKRTARADARRRYRAEQHQTEESSASEGSDEATGARSSAPAGGNPASQGRLGISAAFRASFRPMDVRGDLAALPYLATRTKALWLPLLLVVGSTVAFLVTSGADIVTQFMFAYFIQTPAIGGVFLAGFLAPRAGWLLGLIVGFISAICYAIVIVVVLANETTPSPVPGVAREAIVSAFLMSPVMGAFFAAAAAWYRRFLQLTNPNRGQSQAKAKRGDGRSRTSGSQKAGARR